MNPDRIVEFVGGRLIYLVAISLAAIGRWAFGSGIYRVFFV